MLLNGIMRYNMAVAKDLPCKKFLMLVGACALGVSAVHGATCVWTGGSGNWTDSANWLDGTVPSAGDTVYVSNSVAVASIDIDAPGVSIASIRFEGQGTVTLTGNALTLTGGWSFKNHSGGGTNQKDYGISTLSWLAYGANVECRVPLVFAPSGNNNCGICTATNVVHFREKVTIQGAKTLYLHNGLQPTPDDIAAGVPSGSQTVDVYFHGEVVGENATIRPTQAPTGTVRFNDAVKVAHLQDSGYTSCTVCLYSPSNSWSDVEVDYGNIVFPQAPGVIPSNTVLKLGATYSSSNGRFNLGNFDATIDRIESSDDALKNYVSKSSGAYITSAAYADGTRARYPATLTMKATADSRSTFIVQNMVSLVWDPVGDFTFTVTNRSSTTTGSISVKRGTFRLTGDAAFPNVRDVDVAAGARFSIESSSATPLSRNAFLRLGQGAKLVLASSVSATVGMICVNGTFIADGTYSGTGANAVGWIEGDGEITVSSTGICAWNSAVSGSWSDSANWVGGRVPDGTENGVYIYNDSAEDFTVSIASPLSAFPTNFHIRNLGGGRTTLSCAANVTTTRASIDVGRGARVKVEEGATFFHSTIEPTAYSALSGVTKYDPACVVSIGAGGEWLTSGTTVFTNFYGAFVVKGEPGDAGRFDMRGGTFLFSDLGSSWPIRICRDGVVDLRDGDFRLPHHGYNHETDVKLLGGLLCLSNTLFSTEGKFVTSNGGSIIFGTGDTVFDGTTQFRLGAGNRYLKPDAVGQTARLTMMGESNFLTANDYVPWIIGGVPGGRAVFDYEAGDSVNTRQFFVGDVAGEGELNVKAGLLRVHSKGIHVAGNSGNQTPSETNVTARVAVDADAAMFVRGSIDSGWGAQATLSGIVVGSGNVPALGHPLDGRMDVSGAVTNDIGPTVIGWGAGRGEYVQHGGNTYLMQNASHGLRPITAVGLGGGVGNLIVSNGVFAVQHGQMFIGGCSTNDVTCFHNSTHLQIPWKPSGVPVNNHDAEGTVTVVNGTFSVADDMVVGADGFGTIEMVGNAGTFTAGSLVLSNATSSVVRFVAGAGGFSPIGVTGTLAVTDGTRIEVDLSGYTGNANVFRLFNFTSFDGDLDNVSLVLLDKDGVSRKVCRLSKTDSAIDFAFVNGTTILFR